jgi:rare lipoprotein A
MRIESPRLGALILAAALVVGVVPMRGAAQTSTPAPSAPAAPAPAAPAPAAAGGALTGAVGETQTGLAAYYSGRLQGRRTASGERFNNNALTTAHQTLPFGTKVRVTNTKNNKSVVLRVNDRGPTQPNRILDVSRAAAQRLGFVRTGLVEVKLEVIEVPKARASGKGAGKKK